MTNITISLPDPLWHKWKRTFPRSDANRFVSQAMLDAVKDAERDQAIAQRDEALVELDEALRWMHLFNADADEMESERNAARAQRDELRSKLVEMQKIRDHVTDQINWFDESKKAYADVLRLRQERDAARVERDALLGRAGDAP